MFLFHKSFVLLLMMRQAIGTISGLSYMDPIRFNPFDGKLPGEDPCNPLYWYPRAVPDYCHFKPPVTTTTENTISSCFPPITPPDRFIPPFIPLPPQLILPPPIPPIMPLPPPMLHIPPALPIVPPSSYNIVQPPLIPMQPMQPPLMAYDNLHLQSPHYSYPIQGPQAGLLPGLPGLVSRNGGINIMPFSDAYADMLEKHKNKMIRKKLQRIIHKYEFITNYRRSSRKYRRLLDSE